MPDDELIREGKRRLRSLLPKVKAEMRKADRKETAAPKAVSAIAEAQWPYIREDRIKALVVYPAPLGGWHSDIVFKGLPPGIPNVMGTPVGDPLKTREEAEAHALELLRMALTIAQRNAAEKQQAPKPVFWLYSAVFNLSPETYDAMLAIEPRLREGYGSLQDATDRVENVLSEVLPGVTHETFKDRWEALDREGHLRIMSVLHIAALSGLYRYPARTHGLPGRGGVRDIGEVEDLL